MRKLITIALLLAACSREEPAATTTTAAAPPQTPLPSAAEARALIAGSGVFGEFEFTDAAYSLPVAGSAMNEPARAAARALSSAGWISIDGAGDVMLNAKSRGDKRFLLRPNGILDIVPLARKEMGDVTAVRASPDGTAEADFTWKWVPNEVGAAFLADRYDGTRNARATLLHDGTSWSVLSIK